jgi:hypothetical protein
MSESSELEKMIDLLNEILNVFVVIFDLRNFVFHQKYFPTEITQSHKIITFPFPQMRILEHLVTRKNNNIRQFVEKISKKVDVADHDLRLN